MKIVDANNGDRGRIFCDGREVLFTVRAKLGLRGWVEVFVRSERGFVPNKKRNAALRKRIRCNNVEFVPRGNNAKLAR